MSLDGFCELEPVVVGEVLVIGAVLQSIGEKGDDILVGAVAVGVELRVGKLEIDLLVSGNRLWVTKAEELVDVMLWWLIILVPTYMGLS